MSRIRLENVNVHYPVLQDHYRSLRRAALRTITGGRMYQQDGVIKSVHALKNISLDFRDGDRVGLIGCNGAGKSTLLRTLGRFILPNDGKVYIDGHITSMFRTSSGMDMERTGYDNIFLMGRLLGMGHAEMEEHMNDIIEFSELGDFLRLPIRTYSAGMKVRLSIAIVTCVTPDILLMDEAIGAGDAHFLKKTTERAKKLYERASIIVMASHSKEIIRNLCNKAMWLDHGQIVMYGDTNEVMEAYINKTSHPDPEEKDAA
jgi:ABC-type polysaccharide/polyol phosphate transport system ATPase subunit